ncbi:hypothetical protein P167DRAFT_604300 [Morchella conica CCBAS932]|uniref:Apple domain-containing protein n=1 Tax=Morchella conica CCBAS932 TaxID=1392247 RepID=A0A3N4L7T8_9PEZI|nr:hypothetical protein P167DRAFT_604300 [Morchella conica CCBAS932]
MLISKTIGSIFRTAVFLTCINSVIGTNPVGNIVHARDGRSNPKEVANIIKSNHLDKFCSSWLGANAPATTITKTEIDTKKQHATVTVEQVLTVTKGATTVTTGVTATQGPGTAVVETSYVTDTVTNLSTDFAVVTSHIPAGTETVTTTVATSTVTSDAGIVTSIQTATSVIVSTTTSTTTITATFGTPTVTVARRDSGPAKRERRGRVPDCLEYAPDNLISAGCSLAYGPVKTIVETVTVCTTSTKAAHTTTAYISTTTVPGNIQTATSTTTITNANPTVTTIIRTTSTVFGTVSTTSITLVPSTLTETLSTTFTSTVLSTSTLLTTTTVTTSTTSTAPVATYTVCPGQNRVPGAFGIGVNAGSGVIDVPGSATAEECCLRCYDPARTQRCSGWVFSAPGFCALVYNAAGPNPSATCPNGLGDYFLITGGDPANEVGGPGPCAGNQI